MPEALLVEFVEAEDVVESSGNSTTFQVWSVASGAKDTLRFAGRPVSIATYHTSAILPRDFRLASL